MYTHTHIWLCFDFKGLLFNFVVLTNTAGISHLKDSEVRNPEANKVVWGQHVVSNGTKNTVNNLRKTNRLQHRLHLMYEIIRQKHV